MATKKELPAFTMKGKSAPAKKAAGGKKAMPMMAPPFGKKMPAKKYAEGGEVRGYGAARKPSGGCKGA